PDDVPSLVLLGKIRQSQNRVNEAIVFYRKALKKDPHSEDANYFLMESYVTKKDYRSALTLVKNWEKQDPDDVVPLFYEALLEENSFKNPELANKTYRKILAVESDNTKALSSIAEIYLVRKDFKKDVETLKKMETLAPDDVSLQIKIALIYYGQQE